MDLGHALIKEQLFFRKELIERVYWFIKLRWIAVLAALIGCWVAYFILGPKLPVLPLQLVIVSIFLYNGIFHLIWKKLESATTHEVKPFAVFAHAQISLDLVALYVVIYFTGGASSPLVIFVIFHIILAGILLSPVSCFVYGIAVLCGLGVLVLLQGAGIIAHQPLMHYGPWFPSPLAFPGILVFFFTLSAAILVSAFLITSVKLSLRTKGRELLKISKELDASNAKLTALYNMAREMGGYSDLKELLDAATRNGARIMGVKACSIKLLDKQKKRLEFASTYGLSEDYVAKGSVDIEKSPINRKIIQGSFFSIGKIDEQDYFQYPEDIRKEGIASMICLPLRVERMVLGVFCVYSDIFYFFEESDITFFALMADLTALAIENLKNDLNKSWFLKKTAHELRSPFNTVYSMLKMVRQGYLGAVNQKQDETLQRCERRIELLGELIADLLKLGIKRGEAGKIDMHPVDSATILSALVGPYEAQAAEKGVKIQFDIQDALPEIMAEEKLVDELFTNLISNALKYTPRGGAVRVFLVQEDRDRVRFEVRDTGIGIPEADIPRLFTEFFRAENAKALSDEGTGLGLAIVKEIADRLKGTVSVESKVGEGTCITCMLPSL